MEGRRLGERLREGGDWESRGNTGRDRLGETERGGRGREGKRDWEGGERKTKEGHGWMVGYMNGW